MKEKRNRWHLEETSLHDVIMNFVLNTLAIILLTSIETLYDRKIESRARTKYIFEVYPLTSIGPLYDRKMKEIADT